MKARDMIRTAMTRRQWTQRELAAQVGLSAPYVNDILSGKRGISLEAARRLCEPLGLGMRDILKQQVDDMLAGVGE